MTKKSPDAVDMLKADHKKVKELFSEFEDADSPKEQKRIADEAMMELKIHTVLEEEIFYPTVRREIDDEDKIMEEADEEHHVAKMLIAELEQMQEDDEHFEAKFTVLAESVRHHIKEEEGEMLPRAKKTDVDMKALGEKMMERKEQLKSEGIPASREQELVGSAGKGA